MKEDGSWEQSLPDWMSKDVGGENISEVTYDSDGNCIASVNSRGEEDGSAQVNIYKSMDGKTAKKMIIDDYKDPVTSLQLPLQMAMVNTDTLVTLDYKSANIFRDGKNIASIETPGEGFTYVNDKLVITDSIEDCLDFVNLSNGQIESQIEFDNLRSLNALYSSDCDGNVYMVTRDGVYRTIENGSTLEEIMDAKLTSLNQPSLDIEKLIVFNQDDFYILYCDNIGKRLLKHYVYDKNLPTVPDKKLTVVSLEECESVRQGIYTFESKYPDVWIDYQVLVEEEDGVQKNDAVNKLNTKILAGDGPDIIILDELPMNSYIEKGILADLTTYLKPYLDENKLLPNVVKNATKDNKIYAMPQRIGIAYAYGANEAVKSVDCIESLAAYVSTQKIPLFTGNTILNKVLAQTMYDYYSYEFVQDKSVDENQLNKFLESVKTIANQTQIRPDSMGEFFDPKDTNILCDIFSEGIYEKESQLGMITLRDMTNSFVPIFVTDYVNGSSTAIHNQYCPSGLLGVNAKSEQSELVAKFVETMFSNETQKTYLNDGFPVNMDALTGYQMEDDDCCFSNGLFEAGQPKDKSKLQKILDLFTTLDTPIIVDEVIKDMVVDGTVSFLNGEVSQKEAVDTIVNKVNIYLKE